MTMVRWCTAAFEMKQCSKWKKIDRQAVEGGDLDKVVAISVSKQLRFMLSSLSFYCAPSGFCGLQLLVTAENW